MRWNALHALDDEPMTWQFEYFEGEVESFGKQEGGSLNMI